MCRSYGLWGIDARLGPYLSIAWYSMAQSSQQNRHCQYLPNHSSFGYEILHSGIRHTDVPLCKIWLSTELICRSCRGKCFSRSTVINGPGALPRRNRQTLYLVNQKSFSNENLYTGLTYKKAKLCKVWFEYALFYGGLPPKSSLFLSGASKSRIFSQSPKFWNCV